MVRLKGGDPFVFGRGGEEAEFLADHGIPFEVVPGRHLGGRRPGLRRHPGHAPHCAASVAFVTGHRKAEGDEDEIQCPNADTLVYLWASRTSAAIAAKLLAAGRDPETPAAVVQWGTRPTQRTVIGTLGTIADAVERERIHPPAVLVVGEVVRLREKLAWFERGRDADAAALRGARETGSDVCRACSSRPRPRVRKSTVAIGLAAALRARGRTVQPFKKGPDFIDPMWLSAAAGRPCRNLDFFLMGRERIAASFAEHAAGGRPRPRRGNHGLHDGTDPAGGDSGAALASCSTRPSSSW